MRVLISVDMEGVAGIVDRLDVNPGNSEWSWGRELMTDEASAAVRGVLAHDSDAEIIVCDAHGHFRNILPSRLDPRARLIRGMPRPLDMLTGVDTQVDAVLLIGYHGRAGTADSVLAHTISGRAIDAVRINGATLGEIGLSAALATWYGAIPVLLTGDDTAAAEAHGIAPGITTVTVKWSLGSHAAESLHPNAACAAIEAGATQALVNSSQVDSVRFPDPVDLEVDLQRPAQLERSLLIPGMERRGAKTLAFPGLRLPVACGLIGLIADLAEVD